MASPVNLIGIVGIDGKHGAIRSLLAPGGALGPLNLSTSSTLEEPPRFLLAIAGGPAGKAADIREVLPGETLGRHARLSVGSPPDGAVIVVIKRHHGTAIGVVAPGAALVPGEAVLAVDPEGEVRQAVGFAAHLVPL